MIYLGICYPITVLAFLATVNFGFTHCNFAHHSPFVWLILKKDKSTFAGNIGLSYIWTVWLFIFEIQI